MERRRSLQAADAAPEPAMPMTTPCLPRRRLGRRMTPVTLAMIASVTATATAITSLPGRGSDDPDAPAGSPSLEHGHVQGSTETIANADCPGDVNGDGAVDATDMTVLLAAWGPCPPDDCPADLDGDGQVTITDLIALLGAWGPC